MTPLRWAALALALCALAPPATGDVIMLNFTVGDRTYESLDRLIEGEVGWAQWYEDQQTQWEALPPEVDSVVLGGRALSAIDLEDTRAFLAEFFPEQGRDRRKGLDIGAGIGRVADLLLDFVPVVDLVEPVAAFLDEAERRLRTNNPDGAYVHAGAMQINIEPNSYDVVVLQWVLHLLADVDVVAVLQKVRPALRPNGVVFVKEILPEGHSNEVTVRDARIIRAENYLEELFAAAGFTVVKQADQLDWPATELPVAMYALTSEEITAVPAAADGEPPVALHGQDLTEGYHFSSLQSMWQQELEDRQWYEHNKAYWNEREAEENNPEIVEIDKQDSIAFLDEMLPVAERDSRIALDLGAGVGRVTAGVLLKYAKVVDLVDQGEHFLHEAERRLATVNDGGKYIHAALQDFEPHAEYDVVVLQFTALYLSDDVLVALLKKLLTAVKEPAGFIFFKDSLSRDQKFMINRDSGHNIVRTEEHYRWLFTQAGWYIKRQGFQEHWLHDANPVVMYALYPVTGEGQKHAPPVAPPVIEPPPPPPQPKITVSTKRPR